MTSAGLGMTDEGRQNAVRAYLLPLALNDARGDVFCLFSQSQVAEILGRRPIRRIPFSPPHLRGVLLHDGELLPVIHLGGLFSPARTRRSTAYRQLLVFRTGIADPASGSLLKGAVTVSTRIRTVKFSRQMLGSLFSEQDAPPSLKDSGMLLGYFQRHSTGIALIDLSRVIMGIHR